MTGPAFQDREGAGQLLAERLAGKSWPGRVVLALPRGGIPVALPIARALGAPLDLLFVRKIGAPHHPEFALAAVVDGSPPQLVLNGALGTLDEADERHVRTEHHHAVAEITRRRQLYVDGRAPIDVAGRTVILVDDGLATGTTMGAAVRAVRERASARTVIAVPVAPPAAVAALRAMADDIVCLHAPPAFVAVGAHYHDFHQMTDEEAVRLMHQASDPDAQHQGKPS